MLSDENSKLPHQRPNSLARLSEDLPRKDKLLRIFDRGFNYAIDRRWQSIGELRAAIKSIVEPSANGTSMGLADIGRLISEQSDFQADRLFARHQKKISEECRRILQAIAKALGGDFVISQSARGGNPLEFHFQYGLRHRYRKEIEFRPWLHGYMTGNEVVAVLSRNEKLSADLGDEVIRFPIEGQPDFEQMEPRMAELFTQGLAEQH
jgi:hypothetical protein